MYGLSKKLDDFMQFYAGYCIWVLHSEVPEEGAAAMELTS